MASPTTQKEVQNLFYSMDYGNKYLFGVSFLPTFTYTGDGSATDFWCCALLAQQSQCLLQWLWYAVMFGVSGEIVKINYRLNL